MKWYYIKKDHPESHTYCQVPPTALQSKTEQRACLPTALTERETTKAQMKKKTKFKLFYATKWSKSV